MDELLRQISFFVRGMWHWRWLGLGVAWLVGIVAVVAVMKVPDKYEASARIYVDTESVLRPLMSGLAVEPNLDQRLAILSRTLISRPNVEKLMRMADLDLGVRSKEDQERLIDEIGKQIVIGSTGRDNLYMLMYRDTDPNKARRVVQSLVSMFVESGLGSKRRDTDAAKKFIDDQIKLYERKLEDAEGRLKEFKLKHMAFANSKGGDYYGQVGEVSSVLAQARLDLREAENSRDALKRQLTGEEPVVLPDTPGERSVDTTNAELDGRIEVIKRNLDTLLLKYTDSHPDVVASKRLLEELERQREAERAARRAALAAQPRAAHSVNSNPVYQQLKVSLAEAEANVASLQTRVREYESRYAALKEAARSIPQIDAEFQQLNRDYDVNKRNYESLVARRGSAEMSGEMEAASGVADFRVIDPPRVSPEPVSPKRTLLLGMAILGALVAGLLTTLVASQVRPMFFDARALRDVTGVPVLGSVSMVINEPRRKRERRGLLGFIAGVLTFLAAFGGGFAAFILHTARAG